MSYFVVITETADVLAPNGARTSAATVMSKFGCHMCVGQAHEGDTKTYNSRDLFCGIQLAIS